MIIASIDPGKEGAIVRMNVGQYVSFYDMPVIKAGKTNEIDVHAVKERLNGAEHVFIEKQQSMPGQGVASTFTTGKGYGILIGLCAGMNIPYTLIHPRTWKKEMMLDMGKEKSASIIRAKQLRPDLAEDLTRKKDHNRADALLIGLYGLKTL